MVPFLFFQNNIAGLFRGPQSEERYQDPSGVFVVALEDREACGLAQG